MLIRREIKCLYIIREKDVRYSKYVYEETGREVYIEIGGQEGLSMD